MLGNSLSITALRNVMGPTSVNGLALWLDASRGVVTDGATQFVAAQGHYLSSPDGAQTQAGAGSWTVQGWFYPDAVNTGSTQWLCGKSTSLATGLTEYAIMIQNTVAQVICYVSTASTLYTLSSSAGSVTAGAWHHVALTYDATTGSLSLSLNGSQVAATTVVGAVAITTAPLTFGGRFNSTAAYFGGRLDSWGWHKGVTLSASQVTTLYNSGNGLTYASLPTTLRANLVSWWDMDEQYGIRYDSVGSNHLVPGNSIIAPGIANGDMESAGTWTGNVAGTSTSARDTAVAYNGSASWRLSIDSSGSFADLKQSGILTVGQIYFYSFWAKADQSFVGTLATDATTAGYSLSGVANASNNVVPNNTTIKTTWQQFTGWFVATATDFNIKRNTNCNSRSIWIDNVVLTPLSALVSATQNNGGFETAGSGGSDVFASWSEVASGTSSVNRDTSVFDTGASALRLDIDATNDYAGVLQTILIGGANYYYALRAKASAGGVLSILGGNASVNHVVTTSWTTYTGNFEATSATLEIKRGGTWANASIWVDGLTLGTYGPTTAIGVTAGYAGDQDPLKSVADQSGNNRTFSQSSLAAKPNLVTGGSGINNLPAILFDGSDDLVSGSFVLAQPLTIVGVFKITSNPSGYWWQSGTGACFGSTSGNAYQLNCGSNITGGSYTTGTTVIVSYVANGASSVIRVNGAQVTSGNAGTGGINTMALMGAYAGGSYVGGLIPEYLIYNKLLSASELQTVERYLGGKYGITVA